MAEAIRIDFDALVVPEVLGPTSYEVTQEMVDQYLKVISDSNSWYRETSPFGGPVVPPTFTANDYNRLYRTKYQSYDNVHTYGSHEYANPVRIGDTLTVSGAIVEKYIRRGRSYLVFETTTTNQNGQVVVKSRNVLLVDASKKRPE